VVRAVNEVMPQLDLFSSLARRLLRFSDLPVYLAPVFLGMFVYALIGDYTGETDLLIPSLIGIIWCLLLYSMPMLFARVPPAAGGSDRLAHRLKTKIVRGGFHLLLLVFVVVTGVCLYLSARLLFVWIA